MKIILVLAALSVLAGCATNPRVEDMSSAERGKIAAIEISKGDISKAYEKIGPISGLSCNRNAGQRQDVSDDEALQGIRLNAVKMGADAVVNTFCQKNSDTDWGNNCWASVKCIGDAVRFK